MSVSVSLRQRPYYSYSLDTSTGWFMLSEKENEAVIYDNIHIKWNYVQQGGYYNSQNYSFTMSVDHGATWHTATHFSEVYCLCFPGANFYQEKDRKKNLAPIYMARETWKRNRAKQLKKAIADLPLEERQKRAAELAARKKEIADLKEKQAQKAQVAAINTMISLAPNLLNLKEKVINIINLMDLGGIDKPIIQHHSKERRLRAAVHLLGQFEAHIKKCQARSKK